MRKFWLRALPALLLVSSEGAALAQPCNEAGSPYAAARHRHFAANDPVMSEGRAAYATGGWRELGDSGFHHPTDNGYHDPAFSSQQDEIYNGRF